ncbi:MAG: DUF2510 domain-containing protein [Actinomycetota bacterium]
MNLGSAELIVIAAILGIGLLALGVVIWGLVVAVRRSDWPWAIGIGASAIVFGPVAPIAAAVYLIAYRTNGPTPHELRRSSTAVPEGWYDDPGGEYDMRWWSGDDWSDQVMDNGVNRTRPRTAR